MRASIRSGLAFLLGLVVILPPVPLRAGGQSQAEGRLLLATVVDTTGKTQVDVGIDDFVIREGGDEREVLDVHVADYPIAVLVDDDPGSNELTPIKSAIARFITRVGERPVAVGTLSNPAAFVAALDDPRDEVLARISSLASKPGQTVVEPTTGQTSALPAVAHAARALQETGSPFSAIVVVTGRPIDARIPVEGDLLPLIAESGATLHVVESHAPPMDTTDGGGNAEVPDLLRVLSDQTHGQYTRIFSSASYGTALDRLADKLSVELMIQYLVPPGEVGGDVQVGIRRPGSRVVGLGVK